MNTTFDDLTREIARGTSRRDVLRRFGSGVAGLVLASLGLRKASAATAICGTCQACDLDTSTCGLPCNPLSIGNTLCTQVNNDGSYQRLVGTLSGFQTVGQSDTVQIYQSGALLQSVLITNFQNPNVAGQTALISYAVSPQGDITTQALVLNNGSSAYGFNIDFNGRAVLTMAPQGLSSPSQVSDLVPESARGHQLHSAQEPAEVALSVHSDATSRSCQLQFGVICALITTGVCYALVAGLCVGATAGTGLVPCALTASLLCTVNSTLGCFGLVNKVCACPVGEVSCNGTCCPVGQLCQNGICESGCGIDFPDGCPAPEWCCTVTNGSLPYQVCCGPYSTRCAEVTYYTACE
jgi:hypothetical protein